MRELGKKAPVDENTLFMVGSNTKPLTTLMLAKLVDEGKFSWETPVTLIYPTFKLGSAETTASIRLKHLVCACTGTPRNDWNFLEIRGSTPKQKLDGLATFAPTAKLGEMFQYSDLLVAAAARRSRNWRQGEAISRTDDGSKLVVATHPPAMNASSTTD